MSDNDAHLSIWQAVETTPTDVVKPAKVDGQDITSIDQMYMIRKATELFGPIGIGWNYTIEEERFDEGEPILDPQSQAVICHVLTHTVRLSLWFRWEGEKSEPITQFGHTRYLYKTRSGGWKTDSEAPKKSISDAIKKCLSLLGFAADVYTGMFDNDDYVATRNAETRIAKAEDQEAEIERYREDYKEWLRRECETLEYKIPHPQSISTAADRMLARINDKAAMARVEPQKGHNWIVQARDRGIERVLAERKAQKEKQQRQEQQQEANHE
jgi:hypothetical protein